MSKTNTIVAGIDVAKAKLDVAITAASCAGRSRTTLPVFTTLPACCAPARLPGSVWKPPAATSATVVEYLRKAGFNVVVLQPRQVRAFAEFILCRAKSDCIDAGLIAACVAHHQIEREAPDPRIAAFADQLTFIEQTEEDIVRIKVRLEHTRDPKLRRVMLADIERLKSRRAKVIARLVAALRTHEDLARRLDLLRSIDGVGPRTALAFIIRMPELGRLSREQAAALAGLAPFVHDSGDRKGERHIAGGRDRLRKSVYSAALPAAFRWNTQLITLYKRLTEAGKPHKLALVACARKLVIFANTVLARGTAWSSRPATC